MAPHGGPTAYGSVHRHRAIGDDCRGCVSCAVSVACLRSLESQYYTITALDEYCEFVSNETAFKAYHRAAAVRLECSTLRDDVVTALQNGRLTLELGKSILPHEHTVQPKHLHSWRQGRILHLMSTMLEREQEWEIWAAGFQKIVVSEKYDKRSFIPRLFGGLIIHVHNKQKPMVLFSDEPCP
jgi:hypothetical protein